MQSIITTTDLKFEYNNAEEAAVHNINIKIVEGEFVAVLGHNGSGKSTLAKLFNAIFQPTQGQVLVCGMDTKDDTIVWNIRQIAGMVFQNPDNQLVATIVEEDVAFGLENLGVEPREIRNRVDEALLTVGMSKFSSAAPHMLSGGQKQRVAIAGILAMRPKVIIFDESTAMLDPSGRKEVLETVKRLNKEEHITVVWITHFMEEATQTDRVFVMDQGEIAMMGTPYEVFAQVDRIKEYGLDVPAMAELANELIARGVPITGEILTVDEMVVELCRLKLKI